jgi:cytochrome c biogenesis protein CcdA
MIKHKLHKYQENLFNIVIYLSYTLLILSSLGFSQSAPKYYEILDYYLKIYICLFLIWRFHPFRSYYEFTDLDRKIAFSSGLFILTTTILNQYLISIKDKTKKFIQNKNDNLNS